MNGLTPMSFMICRYSILQQLGHGRQHAGSHLMGPKTFPCALTLAFANVLTPQQTKRGKMFLAGLYSAGRPRQLAAQFQRAGLGVIGLAETRMPRSGWSQIGSCLALYGPRKPSGSHGCSLWSRHEMQSAPGRPDTTVSRQTMVVLTAPPTLLSVNVSALPLNVAFIVARSPLSKAEEEERHKWWEDFREEAARAKRHADFVFLAARR